MIKTLTTILTVLTTLTAFGQSTPVQVVVESRTPDGGLNGFPPYQEVSGIWVDSPLKSTAPGVTSGSGSRSLTNGIGAGFTVKPTLVADKSYVVEITHPFTTLITSNLLTTVAVSGGTGLPGTTGVFSRPNANAWEYVGTLTLDAGVTEPEITFSYATNQLSATGSRRLFADAVRFTEVTSDPPQIVSDPSSRTNLAGTVATFSVSATGSPPMVYRWRRNGIPMNDLGNISGTTTDLLTISNVSSNNIGAYDVIISNNFGGVVSAAAFLTVTNAPAVAPSITNQPQSQAVSVGQVIQLTVGATGTAPLSFQWMKDEIALSNSPGRIVGATTSFLRISNSVPSDAGSYQVRVSNSAGTTNSAVAVVTVSGNPPTITSEPQSQALMAGQNASFSVAVSGSAPMTFRWRKDGAPLSDVGNIFGSTTALLSINNVSSNNVGAYDVVVSNSFGSVVSATATLVVTNPPAVAPSITNQPQSQTVDVGQFVQFSVGASGTAPLSYQWSKDNITLTNGGRYIGVTSRFLTISNAVAADAGEYQVRVSNSAGMTDSAVAVLTVNGDAPSITLQPVSRTVGAGQTTSFSVAASGSTPLAYRWRKDGSALSDSGNISGAGTPSLTLSNVSSNSVGSYDVVVSNSFGTVISDAATLGVTNPPAIAPSITNQPQSQTVSVGQGVQFSVAATGTGPFSYQWTKEGINLTNSFRIFGTTGPSLVISNVASADAGNYQVKVSNSAGEALSTIAVLTVNATAPSITTQPQSRTVTVGQTGFFRVAATGSGPLSYQWTFNGDIIPGATTNLLRIPDARTTNEGAYVVTVSNAGGSTNSAPATLTITALGSTLVVESMLASNVVNSAPAYSETGNWLTSALKSSAAGVTPGVGSRAGIGAVPTFTLKPTLSAGATYTVAITHGFASSIPSNLVANVAVTGGTGLPATTTAFSLAGANTWEEIGTLTLDPGVTQPEITFAYSTNQAPPSTLRRFVADAVRFVLSTNVPETNPPAIVSHPSSQTNLAGATVSFHVSATGTAPLVYRWRKDGTALFDTANIFGAATTSLTISNISAGDAGSYDVVVTNQYGEVLSSAALLVVNQPTPPIIVDQPQNRNTTVGGTSFFSVTADGTEPLSYQWRKDGIILTNTGRINGTTSTFLLISNTLSSDAGIYDVVVSNPGGSVTSDPAVLTVFVPIAISTQPSDQVVSEGDAASFFVAASGTPPFQYQWSADGQNIPGATNDTFTIAAVGADDQRNYRVRVSNGSGTVFSRFATLNIAAPTAVVMESRQPNGTNTVFPYYQEFGNWFNSTAKSAAPGLTGLGSRFFLNGVNPAFSVMPSLPTPGGTYAVEITHGHSPNIPSSNLLVNVLVTGGSGLPEVTTEFGAWSSNVWRRVGILTLDPGVTDPEVLFAYATNQPAAGGTRRFYADGVRFIEIPTAPVIGSDPESQSVRLGDNAAFFVNATGTGPLYYQWKKDGVNLPGATDSSLLLNGVVAADAGTYTVLVTNQVGSASADATLTVNIPATITIAPADQEVIQGQSAVFSVTAMGDAPLSYQWQHNTVNIPGATDAVLTLNNVTTADAGNYTVHVTNSYGATFATATLTVNVPPTIQVQPVDATITMAGEIFSFSVSASGTAPLNYQWQFNGVAIAGATDATLSGNSDDFNGGSYTVVVSNVAGTVTSTTAKLIKPIPAGQYSGLFYETNQVRHESSGFFRMDLASSGSFTGRVSVAGANYPFAGAFSDVHKATVSIARPNNTSLALCVQLRTAGQANQAVGTVSDGTWTAALLADRAVYSTNNPAPQAGEYTVAFIGDSDGTTSPGGNGLGSVTVAANGSVNLHGGLLSDDTSVSQNVPLSQSGHWPFYASLYGGKGSVLGWISFATNENSSFQGNLSWIKKATTIGSYTAGFTNALTAVGSTYLYPPSSPGVLDLTNVIMSISGSSLGATLDFPGVIPTLPSNKLEASVGANQLKLKIKENGRITGTLRWAPTGELLPVTGIVLQQDRTAQGFFIAPDQTTGSFTLQAP